MKVVTVSRGLVEKSLTEGARIQPFAIVEGLPRGRRLVNAHLAVAEPHDLILEFDDGAPEVSVQRVAVRVGK